MFLDVRSLCTSKSARKESSKWKQSSCIPQSGHPGINKPWGCINIKILMGVSVHIANLATHSRSMDPNSENHTPRPCLVQTLPLSLQRCQWGHIICTENTNQPSQRGVTKSQFLCVNNGTESPVVVPDLWNTQSIQTCTSLK